MTNWNKNLRWILIIAVVLLCSLPVTVGYLVSSSSPIVIEGAEAVTAVQLHRVQQMVKKLRNDLLTDASEAEITVTGTDINGLMVFAMRGFPQLTGRTNISRFGLQAALSIYLPRNPFGDYINLSFGMPPSSKGVVLSHATIGSLSIPGETALYIVRLVLNLVLGNDLSMSIFNSVQSIDIDSKIITLRYQPIPNLKSIFNIFKNRIKTVRDDFMWVVDPAVVGIYYESLCQLGRKLDGLSDVSLSFYLAESFTLAAKRAAFNYDAIEENRAALMALAIYLGAIEFDSFVGISREGELAICRQKKPIAELAGRKDLRLHFIYSAALKVLSDSGLSFVIGELKEMLDSVGGGSGFSFVDLAADQAGIRFAELALDSQAGAERLYRMVHLLDDESQFFPVIAGLKEGIPHVYFEKELGGINGQYYADNLAEITRRINALKLYRESVVQTF